MIDSFLWELVRYTRGSGIEIGEKKTFPHFQQVSPALVKAQSLDFVFCRDLGPKTAAVKDWWRLLKFGGYLVVIGESCEDQLDHYMRVRFDAVDDSAWPGIFQVYQRRQNGGKGYVLPRERKKTCAVVRLGAFGDGLQAASILPHLKEEGYHITFYAQPASYEVLKHDPHIDEFYIQDPGQVPGEFLNEFWEHEKAKYDRWINLSESVEGELLPNHERLCFDWPQQARHMLCNVNYSELTHAIAGVPLPVRQKFYASQEEKAWAAKQKEKIGPCIVYSLSGSGINKIWPYMDALIARVMLASKSFKVVLAGDEESRQALAMPWVNEPRVLIKAGEWSIRQAMAFCEQADMVIGPETGLLNACAMMDTPKVVFLSHSSHENLTKHWKNTISLCPDQGKVACYPCHKLIYNWSECNRDSNTGVSACQSAISVEHAWNAIDELFRRRNQEAA